MNIKDIIKKEINQVLKKHFKLKNVDFQIEYPPSPKMGDYSCNIAMVLSKKLKKDPIEIGKEIADLLKNKFEKVEVIKPGFINFYLSQKVLQDNLKEILKDKEKFGKLKNCN